ANLKDPQKDIYCQERTIFRRSGSIVRSSIAASRVADPGSNPGRSTTPSTSGALPSVLPYKIPRKQYGEMKDIHDYGKRLAIAKRRITATPQRFFLFENAKQKQKAKQITVFIAQLDHYSYAC